MPLTVINQPRSMPRRIRARPQGGSDLSALLFDAVGRGFDTFDRRDLLEQQQQNFLEVLRQQAGQSEKAAVSAEERRVTAVESQRDFDKDFRDLQFDTLEQQRDATKTQIGLLKDAAAREIRGARIDEAGLSGELAGREAGRTEQGIRRKADRAAQVGSAPIDTLLEDLGAYLGKGDIDRGGSAALGERGRALNLRTENLVGDLLERLRNPQAGPLARQQDLISADDFQKSLQGLRPSMWQRLFDERGNPTVRQGAGTQADALRDFLGTGIRQDVTAGAFDEETRLKRLIDEALAPARAEQKAILGERRRPSEVPLAPAGNLGPLFDMGGVEPPGEGPILGADLSIPAETIETEVFGPLQDPNALGPLGDDIGSELARRTLLKAGLIA